MNLLEIYQAAKNIARHCAEDDPDSEREAWRILDGVFAELADQRAEAIAATITLPEPPTDPPVTKENDMPRRGRILGPAVGGYYDPSITIIPAENGWVLTLPPIVPPEEPGKDGAPSQPLDSKGVDSEPSGGYGPAPEYGLYAPCPEPKKLVFTHDQIDELWVAVKAHLEAEAGD